MSDQDQDDNDPELMISCDPTRGPFVVFTIGGLCEFELGEEQAHRVAVSVLQGIARIRRAGEPNHGEDQLRAERFGEVTRHASQGVRGDLIAFTFAESLAEVCDAMAPKGREGEAMDSLLTLVGGIARDAYTALRERQAKPAETKPH